MTGTYPIATTSTTQDMAKVRTTVDLEESLVDGLDSLIEPMANDPQVAVLHAGKVKRTTVLRHAIAEGLAILQKRYGEDRASSGNSRKQKPKA